MWLAERPQDLKLTVPFKACHELGDWIEESTALPEKEYAKQPPTLEVCDAVAVKLTGFDAHPSLRQSREGVQGTLGETEAQANCLRIRF